MATPSALHRYTFRDYLQIEKYSRDLKHEFIAGDILAMGGGTRAHAGLTAAIIAALSNALHGGPCRPYSPDLGIRIRAADVSTYADVAVVCDPIEYDTESPIHVTNPRVVVEVLSPSTEAYDRGAKRGFYQLLPSLQEYVVVAQDRRCIELWRRDGADWRHTIHEAGARIRLASIDATLDVDDIYVAAGV